MSGGYARHLRRKAERVLVDGRLVHPRAPHGKPTAYSNYGCRCEPCSTAWSAKIRARRLARHAQSIPDGYGFPVAPPHVRHGRKTTYDNWGCRCRPCVDAKNSYDRDRYAANHGAVAS